MGYGDYSGSVVQALRTRLQTGTKQSLLDMRRSLIAEALSWEGGTLDNPRKYLIAKLPNGQEAYFLKPGKEVANKRRPNPHDMTPVVGRPEYRLRFDEIWAYLSKTAIINPEIFKAALTLIYRDAFLLDHMRVGNSVRYQPNKEIAKSIREMDQEIGSVLPFGLMGLLHFLNLLGWNEDVKYHTENDEPTFKGKYGPNTGRINTLLTCIRVPYQTLHFVRHIMEMSDRPRDIDFTLVYGTMQQFVQSRGTCTPTQRQLLEWLAPYVTR